MKAIVKEAIQAELKYIDEMELGEATTTNRIMHKLGFGEKLSHDDLMDIEYEVYEEVEKSRDYVMDKSSHYGLIQGLPYNLDFVKKERESL